MFYGFVVAGAEDEVFPCDVKRAVGDDGGEFLGEEGLVGVCLDGFLLLAFQGGGVGEEVFDAAVFGNEFLRGFGADAGDAGDIVGGVAHEAEEVDDLVRLGDAPDFRELF